MNQTDTYERALDLLLRYKPEVVELTGSLTTEHPDFAMGNALMAYLCLTATDVPELAAARAAHGQMGCSPMDAHSTMHMAAIGAWLSGDWLRAAAILDEILFAWPTDVLALQVGHLLDFFLGNARSLRDRPARALEAFDRTDPRAAAVRGMYAFGLEECGQYDKAEDAGMEAIDVHPDDVWAIHAVGHTLEMRGLVDRGIPFLRSRIDDWGTGNLFVVHNWWHLSLFELEAGHHAEVFDIYDRHLHNQSSSGLPLEMLDASALLWRLKLDGIDSGDRFAALADAWASRTAEQPWYVFNDVHAAMAFAGAGRFAELGAVIDKMGVDVPAEARRHQHDDDGRDRSPGGAGGAGVRRGSPRRRRRDTRSDPPHAAPFRRLTRPTRRAATHPPRISVARRPILVRRGAARRATRRAPDERVRLGAPPAVVRGHR